MKRQKPVTRLQCSKQCDERPAFHLCDREFDHPGDCLFRCTVKKARKAQSRAKRLAERLHSISDQFEEQIKLGFPAGIEVEYQHGQHMHTATVTDVSGTRIKVRGQRSEYWIEVYRVLESTDAL